MTINIAGRELSIYEVLFARSARWWWDRRYLTEAEQLALSPPLPADLLEEIDENLDKRATVEHFKNIPV